LILGQGTRSHMLQLKISYAITKTQNNPQSSARPGNVSGCFVPPCLPSCLLLWF